MGTITITGDYPLEFADIPGFDPNVSLLAGGGLTRDQLLAMLGTAQMALMQLAMGGKIVKAMYVQGDGTKSVEYTPANITQLNGLILLLQSQLGIVRRARRPINFGMSANTPNGTRRWP